MLKYGQRNEDIKTLQARLNALPDVFPVGDLPVTGYFGSKTDAAVRALQALAASAGMKDVNGNPIAVDGIAGPQVDFLLQPNQIEALRGFAQAGKAAASVQPLLSKPEAHGSTADRLTTNEVPDAPGKQGRYRLLTVTGEAKKERYCDGLVRTEMLLIDPQGHEVWRGDMVTGGKGNGALPGMITNALPKAYAHKATVTEYPIGWNNVIAKRKDKPTFGYADGAPGYSIELTNAPDIRALGGEGRDAFRIHPGGQKQIDNGRVPYSIGCMKMLNDHQARSFWEIMMSLPKDERPVSLEILNRDVVMQPKAVDQRLSVAEASPAEPVHPLAKLAADFGKMLGGRSV